jgi:hypothetical protein
MSSRIINIRVSIITRLPFENMEFDLLSLWIKLKIFWNTDPEEIIWTKEVQRNDGSPIAHICDSKYCSILSRY